MDPHYWPSLYPGILLGLAIGLSHGGIRYAALGGLGGLAGAALALAISTATGITNDYTNLFLLIVISASLAKAACVATSTITTRHQRRPDNSKA